MAAPTTTDDLTALLAVYLEGFDAALECLKAARDRVAARLEETRVGQESETPNGE